MQLDRRQFLAATAVIPAAAAWQAATSARTVKPLLDPGFARVTRVSDGVEIDGMRRSSATSSSSARLRVCASARLRVCASGRTAAEMLAMLTARLGNDPTREIQIAAAEQAKITALRLEAIS